MKNIATLLASTMIAAAAAFNNKAGWKLDADGKITLKDGQPVYVKEDGTETTIDASTISRLNAEAKSNRERAEAAESIVGKFKDIDPDKARDAIAKLSKIDAKQLIDAGEVDKLKDEIAKGYTAQITERDATIATLSSTVDNMTLSTAFSRSKFIADRIAVPPEMFEATFAKQFKVEGGKVVPYDKNGNKIFSKSRMGDLADVDEAFEIMVEGYAHKDAILKAPNVGGSGNGGGGGNRGGGRAIKRGDFDALAPNEKAAAALAAGKGELSIVD